TLPWGSWLYPIPLEWAQASASTGMGPTQAPNSLRLLAATFRESDHPNPVRVRDLSQATMAELDQWMQELQSRAEQRSRTQPLTATELRQALSHAVRFAGTVPETNAKSTDWDRTVQGFLAAAALYRSLCAVDPVVRSPEVESHLQAITQLLRFPAKQDSPTATNTERAQAMAAHWAAVQKWVIDLGPTASH
ncbi:MAG: hypothetical protein LC104_05795, partial [Bacteroidales bacterium]|nr:hypothetical protein [Bacteroidales bacterium]